MKPPPTLPDSAFANYRCCECDEVLAADPRPHHKATGHGAAVSFVRRMEVTKEIREQIEKHGCVIYKIRTGDEGGLFMYAETAFDMPFRRPRDGAPEPKEEAK